MQETYGVIRDAMPYLLLGLYMTVLISVISILISLVIGLIVSFMRMSKLRVFRYPAAIYVNLVRGTPLLIQILFIYFGIPTMTGIKMTTFTAGLIAISLNIGAYMTEIFRSGIESVSKGQMEAGRSLGLSYYLSMKLIVLPQAVRTMLPSFVNQLTHAIKDTSMLSVIGIAELTMVGQSIYAMNFRSFEILSMVGVLYFITIYSISAIATGLEKRYSIK